MLQFLTEMYRNIAQKACSTYNMYKFADMNHYKIYTN